MPEFVRIEALFASERATVAGALAAARSPDAFAGVISYATRLMFNRCLGEMLSEVILPPQPPHPSVMAGSRPVVKPMEPCVVGVFTTIRNAGFLSPNSRTIWSFREWIDIVWPIPPYRRISMHRSQPERQSATI